METKKIAESFLQEAIAAQASDIFILPKDNKNYSVKIRCINEFKMINQLEFESGVELINYFKFIAQMDIAEHRRPQVGSFTYKYDSIDYHLRLSSLGEFQGNESLVIRILYNKQLNNYFYREQLEQLVALARRRGLILTSGPTGSGKTSTMYELARMLQNDQVVMTIEDPVEIHEPAFIQTQVNRNAEISYEVLLKAALRHRPDILIIGEIRDAQTARLAVDAALSGHLVFATVHAKNTLQTISRLEGLGISKVELANCLTAVSYQRLLFNQIDEQLASLLDIASDKTLQNAILDEVRGDFISWKEKLDLLIKRGEINAETYNLFKEG